MIEGEELGQMMDHSPGILKNSENCRDFPDYGELAVSRRRIDAGLTAKGRRVDGELPES